MGKTKPTIKTPIIENKVETVVSVKKKVPGECYTFISNVSIGLDIYGIGERVMLTKDDLKLYSPYVVLTSEYKGQQPVQSAKGCGC